MQYLMVLLLSFGMLVLMIGILLGISYVLGMVLHSRGSRVDPADTSPCAQCNADREWYESLSFWTRNLVTAWWLANRYQCTIRGCG